MDASLKSLVGDPSQNTRYDYGVWTAKRKGKSVVYEYQFVYAGVTTTINLDFLRAASVGRIDQIWNDATAKDISNRIYSDAGNAYYSELKAVLADTNTSIILSPTSEGELKFPVGGRLQFYYANYTAGKICKIVVAVTEL